MLINLQYQRNKEKTNIMTDIILIISNLAITQPLYIDMLLGTKIPQLLQKVMIVTQNNKILVELVVYYKHMLIGSSKDNFENILNLEPLRAFDNLLKTTRFDEGILNSLSGILELLNKIKIYWVEKNKLIWIDTCISGHLTKIENFCLYDNIDIVKIARSVLSKYYDVFNSDCSDLNNVEMETDNF